MKNHSSLLTSQSLLAYNPPSRQNYFKGALSKLEFLNDDEKFANFFKSIASTKTEPHPYESSLTETKRHLSKTKRLITKTRSQSLLEPQPEATSCKEVLSQLQQLALNAYP